MNLQIEEKNIRINSTEYCCVCKSFSSVLYNYTIKTDALSIFCEIQGSSERHVNEGSQLSLFCSIIDISGPPSFVFWYRDGTVVNYSDQGSGVRIVTKTNEADFKISRKNLHEEEAVLVSSLYIDTVKPEDAGKYTCAPSNARNHSVVVHVIKGKNIDK